MERNRGILMQSSLDSVTRIGQNVYRVSIAIDGISRSFEFTVSNAKGINVVNWDDEFQVVASVFGNRAEKVMQAVLSFHQAQDCLLRFSADE